MTQGEKSGSTDPVLAVLLELANEAFPEIFLPDLYAPSASPPPPPTTLTGSAAWGRRSRAVEDRFAEAVAHDPDLRQFGEPLTEHGRYVSASTGISWRIQLRDMAPTLVTSAAANVVLKQRPTDTVGPLLEEVAAMLDTFRSLVRGETREALALTGFEGFAVTEGVRVKTPWGELRAATEPEGLLQPFGPARASAVLEP